MGGGTPKRARVASGCVLLATVGVFVLVKDPDRMGHAERLNQAAEDLASAVEQQWRVEERLRRFQKSACASELDDWSAPGGQGMIVCCVLASVCD